MLFLYLIKEMMIYKVKLCELKFVYLIDNNNTLKNLLFINNYLSHYFRNFYPAGKFN
jgi:hypothetical protein